MLQLTVIALTSAANMYRSNNCEADRTTRSLNKLLTVVRALPNTLVCITNKKTMFAASEEYAFLSSSFTGRLKIFPKWVSIKGFSEVFFKDGWSTNFEYEENMFVFHICVRMKILLTLFHGLEQFLHAFEGSHCTYEWPKTEHENSYGIVI